ncbi:MAG TPA: deoxynucleoside kinase [Rectinemataceae bacterium]|nr:deoxynucleoside kinase [Rectinemataceae bacterium]
MSKRYLVLAGNIGAGKSTLVQLIAERLGFRPYFEPVAENPYLEDFYADMGRWAFHSQLYFLTHRLRSHHELAGDPWSVVQDRSIYEDAEVFARNLHEQGTMSDREWETYHGLYRAVIGLLPAPDLVVYLRCSVPTLKARIAKRARGFESNIPDEYLGGLNRYYEEWLEGFDLSPVFVVPGDSLDFVADSKHLNAIVSGIEDRLRDRQGSLFPVDMKTR